RAKSMSPVALVTGAARGIGAATVQALVAEGWNVVALDICRDQSGLSYPMATRDELVELAELCGDGVLPMVGDVRVRADLDEAVALASSHFGALDAAVAVAGVVAGGPPVWDFDAELWDLM